MNSDIASKVKLRSAMPEDFGAALSLYLDSMAPLTSPLMVWDEAKQSASFASQWKVEDVRVIVFEGRDVGWMQAAETDSEVFLQQLFISPEYRRKGIGSAVLRNLLDPWQTTGKPIVLMVLKNNPARSLYERFGFTVVGENGIKLRMKRDKEVLL